MTLDFSLDEIDVLVEMRRAGAFRTTEDAIRGALFWYARFLALDVDHTVFALALPAAMRARAEAGDVFDETARETAIRQGQRDLFAEVEGEAEV